MKGEIKFSYLFQHGDTGLICEKIFTLSQIEDGIVLKTLIELSRHLVITTRQFTGLHDKKGVEIYEGDIVRFKLDIKPIDETISHGYTEVYYDTELCEFGLRCSFMLFHKQFETDFEVIGNIYSNPELL